MPPTVPVKDKKPSKSKNHSLKQLKRQTKKQTYSLPVPPTAGIPHHNRSDTVTTLYSSASNDCSPNKEDLLRIIDNQNSSILQLQNVIESVKRENESLQMASGHSLERIDKTSTTTTRRDRNTDEHDIDSGSGEPKQSEVLASSVQLLRRQVDQQTGRLQIVKAELNRAHKLMQIKDDQIAKCDKELKNASIMVEEKQNAINTLSDLLNFEQEENEQLRNQPQLTSKQTNTLYNDLLGRVAIAVEIEPTTIPNATSPVIHDFGFKEVDGPVSSAASYIVINHVRSSITALQVGDIVLEVNGCLCRGMGSSAGIQKLKECDKQLRLVIARSQPLDQSMISYDRQGSGTNSYSSDIVPPLPLSPAPKTSDLPSSTSLDNMFVNVFDKPAQQDPLNSVAELAEEVAELKSKCEKLTVAIKRKEQRESDLLKELQSEKTEKNNNMLQVSRLESELKREVNDKERLLSECRDIRNTNDRLTRELEQNKRSLDLQITTNNEKYEELSIQLSSLKNDIQLKDRIIEADEATLTSVQVEVEKTNNSSEEKMARLRAEMELQHSKMANEIKALKVENKRILNELNTSQQEIERLTYDIEKANENIAANEEDTKILNREREEEIERTMSALFQKKLNDTEQEYRKMVQEKERDLGNAQREVMSLGLKVKTLETLQQDRMALLESDLQNSRKHSDRREGTIAEKDNRITQLHFSIKELSTEQQREIQLRMKQLEDTQKDLLTYKEKVQLLEMDKRILQERLTSLDNDVQTLRKESERKDEVTMNKDRQIAELHSTMKEINSEIRLLQKQVLDEKEKGIGLVEKLKGANEELRKVEEKSKQQLRQYETELNAKSSKLDDFINEKDKLEKKLEEVIGALNREKTGNKLEEQRLSQDVEKLKAELEISKKQIEASQREALLYKEKAETLITTIERDLQSTKQQSEKKEESVTEKDRQIIKLYSIVDQLNSEIKSLQEQLKNERDQGESLSQTLKSTNGKVTSLQASNNELNSMIEILKIEAMEMTTKMDRLTQEAVDLKLSISKSDLAKDKMESANAKLKSDFNEKCQEFETYQQTIESNIRVHKDEREASIKTGNDLSSQIAEQERKSQALVTELAELKRKTDLERNSLEKEKQAMVIKLTSLEQQLTTVNNELISQKTSYASMESKTSTLYEQLGYIKSEKEKVEEKYTNAIREHEKLKNDLETARRLSAENASTSQQLMKEQENELERKQNVVKSLEDKLSKIKSENLLLQEKMERIKSEAENEIKQVTTRSSKDADEAKVKEEGLNKEVADLKIEMTEKLNNVQQEIGTLSERNSKLLKQLHELNEQYDALEKIRKSSDEELGEEKNQRELLENKIKELEEKNKRLQENTESEIVKEKSELHNMQEELRKKLEKSQTDQTRLIAEIDQYKIQLNKSNAEITSLNEYIQKLLPVVMEFKPSVLAVQKYPSITY